MSRRNSLIAAALEWFQLNLRCRQPPVEIAPANKRPPFVQEYFDRSPIRDPSEDQQALRNKLRERRGRNSDQHGLADDDGKREHCDADRQCPATNAKQLVEIEPDDAGAIAEIAGDSRTDLARFRKRRLRLRQMHDDAQRALTRQFSGPADNELFRLFVKISLAKRKWVQRVKELGDVLDPELDGISSSL